MLTAVTILVVGNGLFLVAVKLLDGPAMLAFVVWAVPTVAAFVTSWVTPRRKLLAGVLVAVPAAILIGASNYAFEAMGNAVDFPGIRGALLVMGMSLPVVAVVCGVGALAGDLASKRRANAYPRNR